MQHTPLPLLTDSGVAHLTREDSRAYLRLPALKGDPFDSIVELDLDDLSRAVASMLADREHDVPAEEN